MAELPVTGWEREWRTVQEQAGAPRPTTLGCSTISHTHLGFCFGCLPARRDMGATNMSLEIMGWRLLAIAGKVEE